MRHWLQRPFQWLAYIFTAIGALLLLLWAIRGARPTLDCGILDAIRAGAWTQAYTCIDKADFDPLIGLTALVSGILLWLAARLAKSSPATTAQLQSEQDQRNRREMMRRVREIWIDGVLKQSLYHEVLIEMQLEQRPGTTPWGLVRRLPDGSEQKLPIGTDIAEIFAEAHQSLVILGAPGSGKSTELLKLTRALLDECDKDDQGIAPVPVVLNLSRWKTKEKALKAWVIEELGGFYRVPKQLAEQWIHGQVLALMLDGLDEVAEASRNDKVAVINEYLAQNSFMPVAICCREAEYKALKKPVESSGAVRVLPLTDLQIDQYLQEVGGKEATAIGSLLAQVAGLRELASMPLMLNVMMLAANELRQANTQGLIEVHNASAKVFDAYLRTMLSRDRTGLRTFQPSRGKAHKPEYTACDTVRWLKVLARWMHYGPTVFMLDRMAQGRFMVPKEWLLPLRLTMTVFVLAFMLIGELRHWQVFWMVICLVFGLISAFGIEHETSRLVWNPGELVGRLVGGLILGLRLGLLSGLLAGLMLWVMTWQVSGLINGLGIGFTVGLAYELLGSFISGFVTSSPSLAVDMAIESPNAGIRRSLQEGLLLSLFGVLIIGLPVATQAGLVWGLCVGLFFGFATGLFGGVVDFIKHYLLRFALWRDGSLPFRYVRFLNYCTDRILLRRVGGGYMFIHRTFQDYMATVDPARVTSNLDTDRP